LERGAAFRTGGEQLYRRKRLEAFAKWHLAYDTEASEETKSRHEIPFGVFKKLYRSAVVAAKQRADSEDYNDVQSAADSLLEMLPGENDQ
jgi:hypothetical protein